MWRNGADGMWKAIHDMWNTDTKQGISVLGPCPGGMIRRIGAAGDQGQGTGDGQGEDVGAG